MKLVIPAILSLACLSAMAEPYMPTIPGTDRGCIPVLMSHPPQCVSEDRTAPSAQAEPSGFDQLKTTTETLRRLNERIAACDGPCKTEPKYTLITVTEGGTVGHSRGYVTLRMCEQARSMARDGQTLEQREERIAAERRRAEERVAAWRKDHPPRQPVTARERAAKPSSSVCERGRECVYKNSDGLIEDTTYSVFLGVSSARLIGPGDIKHAECVIEAK